jgi:hypothetical protein
MAYCQRCLTIPFLSLPAENEDGWPHHESLEILVQSARSCPLCNLILEAGILGEASSKIRGDNAWSDPTDPGFLELATKIYNIPKISIVQEINNKTRLLWKSYVFEEFHDLIINGEGALVNRFNPRFTTFSGYSGPDGTYGSQGLLQVANGEIRPWLFGSWWLHGQEDPSAQMAMPQLNGIGVRFSRVPGPRRVPVDRRDALHLCGSHIRVVADESE